MAVNLPIADKATLDIVNTNLGSNADASSPSGSIHAKLKAIATSITSLISPKTYYSGTFSTASTSLQTALSITGIGEIVGIVVGGQGTARITVDGSVILDGSFSGSNYLCLAITSTGIGLAAASGKVLLKVSFKSSLLIEISSSLNTSNTSNVGWEYWKN